jgi:acetyl esterase/lipase
MSRIAAVLVSGLVFTLTPAAAAAGTPRMTPERVQYGEGNEYAELYANATHPETVLLLHENGSTVKAVARYAEQLQSGGFTVLALEWQKVPEKFGSQIWGPLTDQVKRAIAYVRANAAALGVDKDRLTMVGGSRGANVSMLTSLKANLSAPGTIKAVVSLSGDPDVLAQIARNRAKIEKGEEPSRKAVNKISKTYGCQKELTSCPFQYIEAWSAYQLVTETGAGATAPPMLLMASELEQQTADWEDQQPMAEALNTAAGVSAEAFIPPSGHGFAYWGEQRERVIAYLRAHT